MKFVTYKRKSASTKIPIAIHVVAMKIATMANCVAQICVASKTRHHLIQKPNQSLPSKMQGQATASLQNQANRNLLSLKPNQNHHLLIPKCVPVHRTKSATATANVSHFARVYSVRQEKSAKLQQACAKTKRHLDHATLTKNAPIRQTAATQMEVAPLAAPKSFVSRVPRTQIAADSITVRSTGMASFVPNAVTK